MQALGQRQAFFLEPGFVDVEVHKTVIHRHHASHHATAVGAVGHDRRRVALGRRTRVGVHNASGQGAWQQGVVDAVDHVGHWRGLAQNELVEHFAGVAALDDLQFHACVFFKLGQQGLGQIKRAVGHDPKRRLRLGRARYQSRHRSHHRNKKPPLHSNRLS